jgi:hypothetical protein
VRKRAIAARFEIAVIRPPIMRKFATPLTRGGTIAPMTRRTGLAADRGGFALVAVLLLLAGLFAGATGIFLACRADLRIAIGHAASIRAFYLAEGGLATWLAGPVQPAVATHGIGGDSVRVEARVLLRVDSATVVYEVSARAEVGSAAGSPDAAVRRTRLLARRTGAAVAVPVEGSWREDFRP